MKLYPIPGSNGLRISDTLEVTDRTGKTVSQIELCGIIVEKSPEWLFGLSRICGKVDEFDIENLEFVYNPESRSKIPWFVRYKTPKVLKGLDEEYRVVPGYPNLAVNSCGNVIDVLTHHTYLTTVTHGYDHIYCRIFRYGKELFVPNYKLTALAWCYNSNPIELVAIDHADGNKRNNFYKNLVWVTYKENSVNAVSQGLIPTAVGGRIRSIHTGEIIEFKSLESMNEFLGMRAKEINHFLTRRRNHVYGGEYEVRIDGDLRPWVYTDESQNVEPGRYIITVHDPSGDKVFNGVRTFIRQYKLWNIGTPSCAHAVEAFSQEHPNIKVDVIDQYDLSPIEMKNLHTGEVITYPDVKTLVDKTKLCKTTVLTAIKYAGRKSIDETYVLRHVTKEPWPKDIIKVVNRPISLKLIDKDTREETTCNSLKEAARKIGRDREYITRCLKHPKETDKYVVRLNSPFLEQSGTKKESELLRTPKAC